MSNSTQTRTDTEWTYLWRYMRAFRLRLAGCVMLALLQSLGLLPIAWLVRRAFDTVIPHARVHDLLLLGGEILLLAVAASCVTLTTRFAALRTTKQAVTAMRSDLVVHCQALPRVYHDTAGRGELHTLLVQDTQVVDVMLNALISSLLPALVLGGALLVLMGAINLELLGLLSLVLPVLYFLSRRLNVRVKARVKRNRDAFSRFSSGVQFMLRRIDLTRYQSAERIETRRQHELIETLRVDSERMAWLQTAYTQAHNGTLMLAAILILVVGGLDVAAGRLSLGSLMSFYVATALLSSSLQQAFTAVPQVMEGFHALTALRDFAGQNAEALYEGTERPAFDSLLELRSVSFSYGRRPVLEDVSLRLEPGSLTAIVGPNGGGKTTIARLILGLYRPQGGCIFASGHSYEAIDVAWLRQYIAFAPQDPIIFAGTIWENLVYGLSEVDPEVVLAACRTALVDEFVQRLPQGYETQLDEDGGVISGGQRQRIAIARAIARRPQLLILDEPTNHLDERSARRLLASLGDLAGRPAILVITQDRDFAEAISQRYMLAEGTLTSVAGEHGAPLNHGAGASR
ncbi:MAG: ABC transporter ATP-binding protein [Acidobacteriota bacterium]